jgi:(2Fe-2S) ferredoxin
MRIPPSMAPYRRHIFICTGEFCDRHQHGEALYEQLGPMLGELADYDDPHRVKRGSTECLGVCAGGPIVVVYPEGIWYHHVDSAVLQLIVDEHLRANQPVESHIFHRLDDLTDD